MSEKARSVDLGSDTESARTPLDAAYAKQVRRIFPQRLDLPISTIENMVEDQIDLNPLFQRRDVWDVNKQSRFIESLLMNVPVPPVFLGETTYGRYDVLDGRQRLTAVLKFIRNEYALKGLRVWSDINKLRYRDLVDKELDRALTRRFIPAIALMKESSPEAKYDVFDRLNTGGMQLEPMEIRNAIFRGPFTLLLHELSANARFAELWGIVLDPKARKANTLYKRMRDLELVLRFFALSDAQGSSGPGRPAFKEYLNKYLAKRNADAEQDRDTLIGCREQFNRAVANCHQVFGAEAFISPRTGKRSAPLADALMYSLSHVEGELLQPGGVADEVASAIQRLALNNKEFDEALTSGTNGRSKIEKRLSLAKQAVDSVLR